METTKKELIAYLRIFDIILLSMVILFGSLGLVTLIFVGVPGIMFLIPACAAFYHWFTKYNEAARLVRELEKNGSLPKVLADFRDGEKFLNGRVIRGESFLMSRGSAKVFALKNVIRIFDTYKKNGFAGETRHLMAELTDGKIYALTFLSQKGKDDDDLRRLTR